MPRRIAAEVKCARCGRIWYADVPDLSKPEEIGCSSLRLSFVGLDHSHKEIEFDALCTVCSKTLASLVEGIGRDMQKASPMRKSRAKKEGAAPSPTTQLPKLPSTSAQSLPAAVAAATQTKTPSQDSSGSPHGTPHGTRIPGPSGTSVPGSR